MQNDQQNSEKESKQKSEKLWTSIILAGGKGTRMMSPLPKVLHPVAGEPMIYKVVKACKSAGMDEVRVVVGYSSNLVKQVVEPLGGVCHVQNEQLGTANAVSSANVDDLTGDVLILNGDHPLIEEADISDWMEDFKVNGYDVCVVSADLKKPDSFGRVVRHQGELAAIVEAKDASASTLKIKEVNTGIYLVKAGVLKTLLPKVKNHNASKEYYLTDIISLAKEDGKKIGVIKSSARVAFGVNEQSQLAKATKYIFKQKAEKLMENGVVIIDPKNTYIENSVSIGNGSVVYPNTHIKGRTKIGSFCLIEPQCFITDCEIDDSARIHAGSYLEKSVIAKKCVVGPYARLRPNSELGEDVKIGNFVELKNTRMSSGAKAGHLTYLGDAEIGERTNIGCGTITCNYAVDKKKYKTKIGSDVFVGSDTQFVAPIEIGDNAIIGSGSTITKTVPDGALAVARGRQFNKEGYQANYQEKLRKKNNLELTKTIKEKE